MGVGNLPFVVAPHPKECMVVLDFRNLTRGELIAGLAGVALFVIMLAVDWYGVRGFEVAFGEPGDVVAGGGGLNFVEVVTRNAFQAFTVIDLVLLLTALTAVALPLWSALGRPATGPFRPGPIVAALGGVAFVLIAFRLISPPDLEIAIPGGGSARVSDFPDMPGASYEVTRKVGPWLGLAATALIAYGGFLSVRDRASLDSGPRTGSPQGEPR
jgi:hypothetical protein